MIEYAGDVGLERQTFARCLGERRFARAVDADLTQARALGIASTPTFLINGRILVGAHPLENFRSVIDDALGSR